MGAEEHQRKRPEVQRIHTNFENSIRAFEVEREKYNRFDSLVTISEVCKKAFVEKYPELESKMVVIPNISDYSTILSRSNEFVPFSNRKGRCVIVTVARIEYVKGIDIAIETADLLHRNGFNFEWHFLGDGSLKDRVEELIRKCTLQDCVFLDGAVTNPYPYMRYCDMIVQPSRNEGKSIVLDEAKILEKPIIVTNYPSVSDQIINGVTGVICEGVPDQLASCIISTFENKDLCEQLCLGCRNSMTSMEDAYKKVRTLIRI